MSWYAKYGYSFTAGAFAAGGSFFGKLPSFLTSLAIANGQFAMANGTTFEVLYLNSFLINVVPLLLMLFCNVMNWRYFLKALQKSEQTLTATVLTAATNYILSFLLGQLVYRETFTMLSACGVSCIVLGLWFLCSAQSPKKKLK